MNQTYARLRKLIIEKNKASSESAAESTLRLHAFDSGMMWSWCCGWIFTIW